MHCTLTQYDIIIFDWDGTLMDSAGHIVQSVCLAATACGLPRPDAESVRAGIGTSFDAQYQRLFVVGTDASSAARSESTYRAFQAAFYRYYGAKRPPLFPAVLPLIQQLMRRNQTLAIATSGTRAMLSEMLHAYQLTDYFLYTYCGDEVAAKPAPDMLEAILLDSGVAQVKAVMIGDSVHDIYAANNAGVDSIGVATGVSSAQDLSEAGAKVVVPAIDQFVD